MSASHAHGPRSCHRLVAVVASLIGAAGVLHAQGASSEAPCSVLRSAAHGVIVLGARERLVGGPGCPIMEEYRAWLASTDRLLSVPRRGRAGRFTGREWDFASGAMRIGAPTEFVLIRGDSITPPRAGVRRLHLSAIVGDGARPADLVGSWYVLVDEDSTSTRLFRSAVTERGLRVVLNDRWGTVWAARGVTVNAQVVRAQLADARALRRALGFEDAMPAAQFIVGPSSDTTLAMLGVHARDRALYAMMVAPPLTVFAPRSAIGGLDRHELVHVATLGRRGVVPASVGEGYAMHHGGSHGRSFADAFCASKAFDSLPALGAAQLDSALAGRWWNDARADVGGFALGHAIGWYIAQRRDSAWVFADGEITTDDDALAYLSRRSGIERGAALERITESFARRRADCAARAITPRAAAPGVPSGPRPPRP